MNLAAMATIILHVENLYFGSLCSIINFTLELEFEAFAVSLPTYPKTLPEAKASFDQALFDAKMS